MTSATLLSSRLAALSTCARTQDIRGREGLLAVSFDITKPSPQFLSDLYDACAASIAHSDGTDARASEGGSAQACDAPDEARFSDPGSQLRATCAAAALHYLTQQDGRVVQQFLDAFFLPLLARSASLPDKACRLQICTGLAALLVSARLWKQLRHLASACCLAPDAAQVPVEAQAGGSLAANRVAGLAAASRDGVGGSLPLRVSCTVLTAVVQQLCPLVAGKEALAGDGADVGAGGEVLRWVLSRLRAALRPLLSNPAAPVRQAALKALVPTTLAAAQACGGSELVAMAREMWQLAMDLLGGSGEGAAAAGGGGVAAGGSAAAGGTAVVCSASQRAALALLVSASGLLTDPAAGVDVAGCTRFWELLRMCLALPADVDALERKRAVLLLQRLAPPGQMGQPGWALWGALYDILDEFPIHLVAAVWAKVDQLHPPAPEFRTEAVVPKSYIPRKKELKQRKTTAPNPEPAANPTTQDAAGANGSTVVAASGAAAANGAGAAGGGGAEAVPQAWQCVLWARALQHGNIQVQRLGMRTFLQRDWRLPEALRGVPPGFVGGVLLPALTRDIHYRGGAAEAEVLDVAALAVAWMQGWFAVAPLEHRMEALLAVRLAAGGSDLSRLGLQQLMRCVAAAAAAAATDGALQSAVTAATGSGGGGGGGSAAAAFPGAMLSALRGVLVYLVNFTGLPYKRSVWRSVLTTAAVAAPPAAAGGCSGCLRLLLELPASTLEPGGELREQARAWLLGRPPAALPEDGGDDAAATTTALSRSEAAAVSAWLRNMLDEYWGQGQAPAAPAAGGGNGGTVTAATIVQLLLLFDDVDAATAAVVQRLQQALYGMYGRPYLQAGESYRALALLRELLAALARLSVAAPANATGSVSSASSPATSLPSAVCDLLVACCDDICSAASHASDAFLEPNPPQGAGDLARADAAWGCVSLALLHTCRAPDPPAASVATTSRRLASALLALLVRLGGAPLPAARHAAVVVGMRAATAAAEALRQAAASSPELRPLVAERLDPNALAAAALRDAAAAAATAGASAATHGAAAVGVAPDVSQVQAEVEAAKWPLLDAATALASYDLAAPPPSPSAAAVRGVRVRAAASSGGLTVSVVSQVLSQSVSALSEYPEGQVLQLLRCLRRCWVAVALGGEEMQAVAAQALGADIPSSAAADGSTALESLCWPVVRALWNALCATPRRTGPLCAAFVNTALLPCLYVKQAGPQLRALHGPSGPCRWLLSRLLEWGGASSRFLLLLACQLGSFLHLQPALVECYCREMQSLLLWGSRKGSSYDPEGPATDGAEAEELSAVAAPLEPGLVGGAAIGTEVAPRVALLCCIHHIAEKAGVVWPPAAPPAQAPPPPPPPAPAPVASRRPVIVFGESSLWDEQTSGGSTAARGSAAPPAPTAAAAPEDTDDDPAADYGAPPPADPSDPCLSAGRLLWRQLLSVALTDPVLSTDKVRNGSELHRQKVRLWQALVVLTSFVPREECGQALGDMLGQLNGNNPPTVKQYIEAVVAALVLREPSLLHSHLLPLLASYGRHASGLGSHILIAAQVLLHSPPAVQRAQLRPLLLGLSPWLMCHGHNVRTYAQLVLWALLQRFPPESPMWAHSVGDLSYLRQMLEFMRTNVDLVRLRRNIGDPILEWSPAAMAHPCRVFASAPDGVCLAGYPIESVAFEGAPPTLVDRIQTFLVSERHRLRDELADRAAEREFFFAGPQQGGEQRETGAAGAAAAAEGGGGGGIGDFQRKIKPEALMASLTLQGSAPGAGAGAGAGAAVQGAVAEEGGGLAALLAAEEEEAQGDWKSSSASGSRRRHDVLLVASLIDKLPNLAGLARTCEVLGAGRLVLADLAATKDPLFTSVSVTAEQWLPLEEVKPAALLAWLERRAAEGYTLVGLEQTSESVRLPDYVWPDKVVLVLGREKEGMPPEVLSLLDATLEIPQRGIIRSLNVHVSGAIALYEYLRQMQQPGASAGALAAAANGGV